MEEDSVFGLPSLGAMAFTHRIAFGFLSALAFVTAAGRAGPPNVRGKITGFDKLVPEVYAEAAKPEARRWTWREPSPSVPTQFRVLSANPSRDICIAALTGANQEKQEFRMTVTGGRVFPTTIVVTPNTHLVFKNFDPFPHRIYAVGQPAFKPENLAANGTRDWAAPGAGKYEIRDELFPSVRTFVIVDPQVVAVTYPGRDGAFGFSLPGGEYVLKAFFNGKQVGKAINFNAKDKGTVDIKEALKVDEGGETK